MVIKQVTIEGPLAGFLLIETWNAYRDSESGFEVIRGHTFGNIRVVDWLGFACELSERKNTWLAQKSHRRRRKRRRLP